MKETITKGFEFHTEEGYATCMDYNGSIVFCDEHIINPETGVEEATEKRMLTLCEIAKYLKDFKDGKNHNLIWEDPLKYRVVSDRRSYGVYDTYEEAYEVYQDLVRESCCRYSNEDFWIEEE